MMGAASNPADFELSRADEGIWGKYRSDWWKLYFTGDLAHFWPSQLDDPEVDDDGYRWISREQVFAIAADGSPVHTAVASAVWGVGKWGWRVGRFVRPFTRNPDVKDSLTRATAVLANEGSVSAYAAMLPGREAWTRFLGPAYFTKFLYFTGYRACTGLRPLILDRRVARALRGRGVFPEKSGDTGWSPSLYRTYLEYTHDLNPSDPALVELELFNEGKG